MTEEEEEEEDKKVKITWINGKACMDLNTEIVPPKQKDSVDNPFTFGWLKEIRRRESKSQNFNDELNKYFNFPGFSNIEWRVFKLDEFGNIEEIKKDDEDDN